MKQIEINCRELLWPQFMVTMNRDLRAGISRRAMGRFYDLAFYIWDEIRGVR